MTTTIVDGRPTPTKAPARTAPGTDSARRHGRRRRRHQNTRRGCGRSLRRNAKRSLANGQTKKISEIEVGDWVWATDTETGETGPRQVTATWPHSDYLLDLELADGSRITTTEDHHYWNHTDQAWQETQELDSGDLLLTPDGDGIAVEGLDWTSWEWAAAYDLTVDEIHTYYVQTSADENVLVHNCTEFKRMLDDGSGIYGEVNDGILDFAVEVYPGSEMRGYELFDEMMASLGDEVTSVRGNWTYGDNLAEVNRLTAEGTSLEDAVMNTWTATQASRHGYTTADIVTTTGSPGNYTKVEVLFGQ